VVRVAPDGASTRQRLVAAARELILRDGLSRLTVGNICDAANVSRATFYLHFANRNDVVGALVVEEAAVLRSSLEKKAKRYPNFAELCVEMMLESLHAVERNKVVYGLLNDDRASRAARLSTTSAAFDEVAMGLWEPLLRDAQHRGEARAGLDPTDVVHWFRRIFLSYLEAAEGHRPTDEAMRRELETFLLPAMLSDETARAYATDHALRSLVGTIASRSADLAGAVDELRRHTAS
jgi:AcrR family transcriptional regulator